MPEYKNAVGGQKYCASFCNNQQQHIGVLVARKHNNQSMIIEQEMLNFVGGLQNLLLDFKMEIFVFSKYKQEGLIFCANTNFMNNVWRDWAIFNWGNEGNLPCHIMGFVDLSFLPENYLFDCTLISDIKKGVYAIVECANCVENEEEINKSEMFTPIKKTVGGYTGDNVSHRIFYLADCEAIVSPIAVVPNIGGEQNDCFEIKMRKL